VNNNQSQLLYRVPDHPDQIFWQALHHSSKSLYSDYIVKESVKDVSTKAIVKFFQEIFATHGIRFLLITDCGTNCTSQEFSQFAVEHSQAKLSPHHHQSNGRAEAKVKVAKGLLERVVMVHQPLWLLWLVQRNTPFKGKDLSPRSSKSA
jgi:hypothetical protein